MNERIILITRAAVMIAAAAYLWRAGKDRALRRQGGWNFIVGGFSLLLLGLLLKVYEIFSVPDGFNLPISPGVEFILRDVAGYLLGMLLMVIGFMRWLPSVREQAEARKKLERAGAEQERTIAERTAHLEELNLRLERELAERREVDQELEKFRTICVRAPYGIGITDPEGNLIYVNRAMAEMNGWTAGELVGKNVEIFHKKEHRPLIRKMLETTRRDGAIPTQEILYVRRDGTTFPAMITGTVIKDGDGRIAFVAAVIIDITARKEKEAELVRLSSALAGLAEMAIITDLEHRIVYANEAAEKILGYRPEEMTGRDSRKFFEGLPGNPPNLAERMRAEAAGGAWEGELLNRRKDGTLIDIHLTMTVLRGEEGEANGFVGITRDITEKKRGAARLEKAYRDIRDIKSQLIEAEKLSSLGLLAAGVAHELNSPLDGLLTLLRLDRKQTGKGTPEEERTEAMLAAAEHMARIVGDLTAFARRSEGEFREVALNRIIESTLSFCACQLAARNITVIKEFEEELEKVLGDRGQLQQVILNLITNARDTMESGGRLEIRTRNSPGRRSVTVTVSDTGPGIAPEDRDRLFDPFFTTKPPGEGLGLGLSVAYGIVESHRGEITVESEPGRGAAFTVRLPAARAKRDETPPDPSG